MGICLEDVDTNLLEIRGENLLETIFGRSKFKYPIFAKREIYEKKFVHGFYALMSYLVMTKGDHDMLTILGESVKHLWVTLCICVTWTLISGVIIWLLVSLVTLLRLFDKLGVHFLHSVGQSGEILRLTHTILS